MTNCNEQMAELRADEMTQVSGGHGTHVAGTIGVVANNVVMSTNDTSAVCHGVTVLAYARVDGSGL
jgi:hypothetical protein